MRRSTKNERWQTSIHIATKCNVYLKHARQLLVVAALLHNYNSFCHDRIQTAGTPHWLFYSLQAKNLCVPTALVVHTECSSLQHHRGLCASSALTPLHTSCQGEIDQRPAITKDPAVGACPLSLFASLPTMHGHQEHLQQHCKDLQQADNKGSRFGRTLQIATAAGLQLVPARAQPHQRPPCKNRPRAGASAPGFCPRR